MTGTLAEPALRRVLGEMVDAGLAADPVVVVLNIQVAALMTAEWVDRKLSLPEGEAVDRVVLPGYCRGDLTPIADRLGVPVELGPPSVHDLPDLFGRRRESAEGYGDYTLEIIAEINHAPRLGMQAIVDEADSLRTDGAAVIDVGCDPQADRPAWAGLADVVRELRGRGHRVSVDSFHPVEVEAAVDAGAELVLSVNTSNVDALCRLGAELVATPDTPDDLASLDRTIEQLAHHGADFRVDPIVEPIGFGFAASLGRYLDVRRRYPDVAMMMGVGNLTEMTEADSAGVNMLLAGFCQELNIASVLTTQVINWSRTAVKELDIARRVMHHATKRGTPPKHIDERLVMLRDPKLRTMSDDELRALAEGLTDRNIRLFADPVGQTLHAMRKGLHVQGDDPFALFDQLDIDEPSHAFYLGYEMAKAVTAMTLGKNYVQDEPLRWGILTRDEVSHFENRKRGRQP